MPNTRKTSERALFWLIASLLMLTSCSPAAGSPTPTPFVVLQVTAPQLEPAADSSPTPSETRVPSLTNTPDQQAPVSTATAAGEPTTVPFKGLPNPSDYTWSPVVGGLQVPVYVTGAGDGSSGLYVVSQAGLIYLVQEGVLSQEPFLDISDRTSQPRGGGRYGERGLLGLAFHPDYEQNGFFYVNYTDRDGNTHISRFERRADNPFSADPRSEFNLLYVEQPYPNHNGGGLTFGPDGLLYIALGDGGSAGDPLGNGQSLQTYLGKILRIDVDVDPPYAVPPGNPFATEGGFPEVWVYGLRNPWRIAFDSLSGDLYIADVGQNAYEEVNVQPAGSAGGENYGWNLREGGHAFQGTPPEGLVLVEPVAEYNHELGCSITGGGVYRGVNLEEWLGVYLYGDYCSGRIWGLVQNPDGSWQDELLFETGFTISSFGVDDEGEIYLCDYANGRIYRLERK